jgi:ribulose-phosphate 3-epimerase
MVPKISFGAPVVAACRKAFPKDTSVILDVKLGCIEPEHLIDDFVKAGADILSVHPESTVQLGAVINKIAQSGVAPGVVLNPGTPVEAVQHVLPQCQVAVVMLVCKKALSFASHFHFFEACLNSLLIKLLFELFRSAC